MALTGHRTRSMLDRYGAHTRSARAQEAYRKAARKLSGARGKASRALSKAVEAELPDLKLGGTLAGFAGFLALARFGTTSISGNTTVNLDAIAAIVIGGTSLFGGVGTVIGTIVGVFIPAVLRNGFVIVGVQPFWQQVAVGAVLIVAVYVDQLRRARYAR